MSKYSVKEQRLGRFEIWRKWVLKNKRFPKFKSNDAYERQLWAMISNLRAVIKGDPDYSEILDEYQRLKKEYGFFSNSKKKKRPDANIKEIITWAKKHGRRPNQYGITQEERRLAYRTNRLMAKLRKEPEKYKALIKQYEDMMSSFKCT